MEIVFKTPQRLKSFIIDIADCGRNCDMVIYLSDDRLARELRDILMDKTRTGLSLAQKPGYYDLNTSDGNFQFVIPHMQAGDADPSERKPTTDIIRLEETPAVKRGPAMPLVYRADEREALVSRTYASNGPG